MPILLFLKALDFKSWIIIALSTIIIGLWVTLQFKSISIGSLTNKLNEKELVIQQYKTDVLNLTEAVKKQNEAVDELAKRNDEFKDTLDNAGEENARLTAQAEKMIAMIKKNHVPADCKGATDHLDSFTKDFAKDWNK